MRKDRLSFEEAIRVLKDVYLAVHQQTHRCNPGETDIAWEVYEKQLKEALEQAGEPVYER